MKIKKFFNVYVWFLLPIFGIIIAIKDFYPNTIPFNRDILIGIIMVLAVGSIAFSFYNGFKGLFKHLFSGGQRNKILEIGKPARAKILNLKESDEGTVTINDQPFATIEVEINDGINKPYKTEIKTIISRLEIPKLQPGNFIAVKVDPNDKMKVVIDPEGEIFKKNNSINLIKK
jgi:hypothetical protein